MGCDGATLKKAILFFDEIHFMDRPAFTFQTGPKASWGMIGSQSYLRPYEQSFREEGVPFYVHDAPGGPVRVKWSPLSRPNLVSNKLTSDRSDVYFGRPQHRSRPLPFRRSKRRSGRIPAEPCLPFGYHQCTSGHSGPKALNPRGSGTASPSLAKLRSVLTVRSS